MVSSTYFKLKFSVWSGVKSLVYNVNRRRLGTQPWGAPDLSTNVEELWLPIWTLWGLLVWKSNTRCKVLYSSPVFSFQSASWVILCWTLSWRQQTAYWCSCFYSPGVCMICFSSCVASSQTRLQFESHRVRMPESIEWRLTRVVGPGIPAVRTDRTAAGVLS